MWTIARESKIAIDILKSFKKAYDFNIHIWNAMFFFSNGKEQKYKIRELLLDKIIFQSRLDFTVTDLTLNLRF